MDRHSCILRYIVLLIIPVAISANSNCQDINYVKEITHTLGASDMHGRGYVKKGDVRASTFIKREFQRIGVAPFTSGYFQPFSLAVNTFPGAMNLEVNGKSLVAGRDYMIDPSSDGCKGSYKAFTIPVKVLLQDDADSQVLSAAGNVLILDARRLNELSDREKRRVSAYCQVLFAENKPNVRAVLELTNEKLSFGISPDVNAIPYFRVNAAVCPDTIFEVTLNIRNRFFKQYETRNVAGFIPGSTCPDSMLIFTAHYDHLGMMGKTVFFPGANDNASGTAAILALAEEFIKKPHRYTVVFIVFSGEELGLLGSNHFAAEPLLDLSKIKFLINLDQVGFGSEGITVVNGSVFPELFKVLVSINDSAHLLPVIKKRGEACISDHCPFYRRGVPSFFIYTMGGSTAYHDLNDRPEFLTYNGYIGLTKLLIEFVKYL